MKFNKLHRLLFKSNQKSLHKLIRCLRVVSYLWKQTKQLILIVELKVSKESQIKGQETQYNNQP